MSPSRQVARVVLAGALVACPGLGEREAAAQSLADGVEAATGEVAFHFKGKEGLEGCGDGNVSLDGAQDHRTRWSRSGEECGPGPVLVLLEMLDGAPRDLRVRVGPRVHLDVEADLDLGRVPAAEASDYLLEVAWTAPSRVAEDAVFPAFLADSTPVWPRLLDLARDRSRPDDVRSSALFWVGQEAAGVAIEGLAEVALDDTEDQRIRESAVFALSQRPADEGLPILMDVARTAIQAETRRSAMFWLAESEDPRVVAFFEEVLLGRR